MRYFIPLALFILVFSSCSSYQYLTLNSSALKQNDKKQFVWENDTLRIIYDFNGSDGPMNVEIYNKSNQPLYINWKKSAFIRDEHSISLFDRNVTVSGTAGSSAIHLGVYSRSTSDFTASFALPEGMDFIPPASSIDKELIYVAQSGPLAAAAVDSARKQQLQLSDGSQVKYRQISFDEDQSPVRFRTYLTFTLGASSSPEFSEGNSFYVGRFIRTNVAPDLFPLYQQEGDQLFVKMAGQ